MVSSNRHVHRSRAASGGLVGAADFAQATWRKSSWSSFNGNCVEVAELREGQLIGVRDTKDAGCGPVLVFPDVAWRSFVHSVKNDY